MKERLGALLFLLVVLLPALVSADMMTGEGPNLGDFDDRITQNKIVGGLSFSEIRTAGLRVFATPFNKFDGFGDGPFHLSTGDPLEPGSRPTLQGNGTFLRVNGLDAQTCLECHFITRNSTIPAILGIGGVGVVQPEQCQGQASSILPGTFLLLELTTVDSSIPLFCLAPVLWN